MVVYVLYMKEMEIELDNALYGSFCSRHMQVQIQVQIPNKQVKQNNMMIVKVNMKSLAHQNQKGGDC